MCVINVGETSVAEEAARRMHSRDERMINATTPATHDDNANITERIGLCGTQRRAAPIGEARHVHGCHHASSPTRYMLFTVDVNARTVCSSTSAPINRAHVATSQLR